MAKRRRQDDLRKFTWQSGCWGKSKFPNGALAFQAAQRLPGRGMGYRCRHCGSWHVGNAQRTVARPSRKRLAGDLDIWRGIDLEAYRDEAP